MKKTEFALTVLALAATSQVNAGALAGGHATGVANAVGAKGVLSNPALPALYPGRLVDIILPRAGVSVADNDSVVSRVDDLVDLASDIQFSSFSPEEFLRHEQKLKSSLAKLNRSQMPTLNGVADGVISINLPGKVGGAFFISGDAALTSVARVGQDDDDPLQAYMDSEMDVIGRGILDVGVSLSYGSNYGLHEYSIGLAPKIQTVTIYAETFSLDDYKLDLNGDSLKSDSSFNADFGLAYKYGHWSAGLVGRDLIENESSIKVGGHRYDVSNTSSWSVGAGYNYGMWSVALDVDLTEIKLLSEHEGQQFVSLSSGAQLLPIVGIKASTSYELAAGEMWLGLGLTANVIPRNELELDFTISQDGSLGAMAQLRWYL